MEMTEQDSGQANNREHKLFMNRLKQQFEDTQFRTGNELELPKGNSTGSLSLDINLQVPIYEGSIVEIFSNEGAGKCLGKGTPVLMFDGTIKAVEDITKDDLVMGPDSKPRQVISIARGKEEMFEVIPTKGDKFTCNRSHILTIKMSGKTYQPNQLIDISVDAYLKLGPTHQHDAMLCRTGVEFQNDLELKLPPRLLGIWLGDGASAGTRFSTIDLEIQNYLANYAIDYGMTLKKVSGENCDYDITMSVEERRVGCNHLLNVLREYNLIDNKHIPHGYLTASRTDRLELLAGLIDTDGHLDKTGFEIIQKSKRLSDDILYLARSLGFAAYQSTCQKSCLYRGEVKHGTYYRVFISGDVSEVPVLLDRKRAPARKQIKNVLHTGFEVIPLGDGEYYGFTLDGPDGRFLLGDFTITHNTTLVLSILEQAALRGKKLLFLDQEQALQPTLVDSFPSLRKEGVLEIITAPTGEDALKIAELWALQYPGSIIAIDSVDALLPQQTEEKDIGEKDVGTLPKLMSAGCRKLQHAVGRSKSTVIFLNQMRSKIGAYGNPDTTSGGRALPFYASQRIQLMDITSKTRIMSDEGNQIGHVVRFKVVKNKVAPPFVSGEFPLIYGKGIDIYEELATMAGDLGLIERDGKYFLVPDSDGTIKKRPHKTFVDILRSDPEYYAKLLGELRSLYPETFGE